MKKFPLQAHKSSDTNSGGGSSSGTGSGGGCSAYYAHAVLVVV